MSQPTAILQFPVALAGTNGSGPVNALVQSDTLAAVALSLADAGHRELAEQVWRASMTADANGAPIHLPGYESPYGVMKDDGGGFMKALLMQNFNLNKGSGGGAEPKPTPTKISEALYLLGGYTGMDIRDPFNLTSRTNEFLRRIARLPHVYAVLSVDVMKLARFCKIPRRPDDTGFEIRMRDRKALVTRAAQKRIDVLTDFVLSGGFRRLPNNELRRHPKTGEPGVWDGLHMEKAHPMVKRLSNLMFDSLSMDWGCVRFEPGQDEQKYPVAFYTSAPSQEIALTDEVRYTPRILPAGSHVKYVQRGYTMGDSMNVVREFTWDRLSAMVMRPRTDWLGRGYGEAPLEVAITIVAGISQGMDFRQTYLDANHVPPMLLAFVGNAVTDPGNGAINGLRAQMAQIGGTGAHWKALVTWLQQGSDIKALPLRAQMGGTGEMNWAMQFGMELFAILCAVMGKDPEEVSSFYGRGFRSSLSEPNPEARLEHSEDKSFKPRMDAIACFENEHVVWRLDEDFLLEWVNLDDDNQELKEQAAQALLARGWTPNQVKDQLDEPRMRLPVDTVLYQDVERRYNQEKFDTSDDYRAAVDAAFEKECKNLGYPQTWSAALDAPVGNQGAMQLWMQEQQMLTQSRQASRVQEGLADPDGESGSNDFSDRREKPQNKDDEDEDDPVRKSVVEIVVGRG